MPRYRLMPQDRRSGNAPRGGSTGLRRLPLLLPVFLALFCGCIVDGGMDVAVRFETTDADVASVTVAVEDGQGSPVGSGPLAKGVAGWSGSIRIGRTGTAVFQARAKAADGSVLYFGRVRAALAGNGDAVAIPVGQRCVVPGAALCSWKDFLYVLGGRDAAGNFRGETWVSRIGGDGGPGAWTRSVDLPEAAAFASCVVAGDFVYVVGGETSGGFREKAFYAMVQADESSSAYGGLGGFPTGWQIAPRSLPAAVSGAGAVIDDGRVLLAGGKASGGPVDAVVVGRIRRDGSVGQWYSSPNGMPSARGGAGIALRGGRVWAVGGAGAGGVLPDALSAPWSSFFNGAFTAEASMDVARAFPVLAADGGGLLLFGGWNGTGAREDGRRLPDGGAWTGIDVDCGQAYGPGAAVVDGRVYYVSRINGTDPPEVAVIDLPDPVADPPSVFPGSGWVGPGLVPTVRAYPGCEVRYTVGTPEAPPESPSAASPLLDLSSPPAVGADAVFRFRAFSAVPGDPGSAETIRTYRVRTVGLFPYIQWTLSPSNGSGGLTAYCLKETYSDETSVDVSSVWIGISVAVRGIHALRWADSSDDAQYTAGVTVSLYEDDFYAGVYDRCGLEITGRTGGSVEPILVELAPGTYYLNVASQNGAMGGTFGLSVVRQ